MEESEIQEVRARMKRAEDNKTRGRELVCEHNKELAQLVIDHINKEVALLASFAAHHPEEVCEVEVATGTKKLLWPFDHIYTTPEGLNMYGQSLYVSIDASPVIYLQGITLEPLQLEKESLDSLTDIRNSLHSRLQEG